MIYQFKCPRHGTFEVNQPMLVEHKTVCPKCGTEGQRVYSPLKHIWAGNAFRPDGSIRPDSDYAPVMRG